MSTEQVRDPATVVDGVDDESDDFTAVEMKREDEHKKEMKRLCDLLNRVSERFSQELDEIFELEDEAQEKDEEEKDKINAELNKLRENKKKNVKLLKRLKRVTNDLAKAESRAEESIRQYTRNEKFLKRAQKDQKQKEMTRAKMLGEKFEHKPLHCYKSSETIQYSADMKGWTEELKMMENQKKELLKEENELLEMDLFAKITVIDEQMRELKEKLENVDNGTGELSMREWEMDQFVDEYKKMKVLSGMLEEYEEYMNDEMYRKPFQEWEKIKSGGGRFKKFWSEQWVRKVGDEETDELEPFAEYLYHLVSECNKHRYKYLKCGQVVDCRCRRRYLDVENDSWCSYEGYRVGDKRCSHGRSMYWEDEDDWGDESKHDCGVMFNLSEDGLTFTITDTWTPGELVHC